MDMFSDGGSTPPASTKWTLDEHLFFQRRFRRRGSLLMSKQKMRVKVLYPWPSLFCLRRLRCLRAASATLRMPPGLPQCRSTRMLLYVTRFDGYNASVLLLLFVTIFVYVPMLASHKERLGSLRFHAFPYGCGDRT